MEQETKKLFQDDEGNPVVFFFRPCAARSKTQPIIEENGGKVTAKFALKPNAIKLANEDDFLVSDDNYSVRYIEDCVKAKTFLDKEKYRLQPRKSVLRDDEQVSDISFDEDAPLTVRARSKYFQGRKMYTNEEDMAILKYIIDNDYHDKVSGITIWKEMEDLEITKHSSGSMNTRYRKIIKNNLNLYSVPLKDKKKLSQDYVATSDDADSPTKTEHQKFPNCEEVGESVPKIKFSKSSPQKANSPTKESGENVKGRTRSQRPSKLVTKFPFPKKTVITHRSKYFDDSSDDSVDESNTIPTGVKTKKMKLKFTCDNEQPTSESATQKTSPKKMKNTEKSSHGAEKDTSATDNHSHAGKEDIMTSHSGKSKEKNHENEEQEIDKQSVEPVKNPVGRLRKSRGKNEMSPRNKSKESERGQRCSLGTPSKSKTESPQSKSDWKKNPTTGSSPKVNERGKPSISDSPKPGPSCKQSNPQKTGKKLQKTLYNSESATLTPNQMKNLSSLSKTKSDISPSSLYKSTSEGVRKSSRYARIDSKASIKRKSPHGNSTSKLDDSVDDNELEDDFDKELMKRVALTSTQLIGDEAPSTPKKSRFTKMCMEKDSGEEPKGVVSSEKSKPLEGTPERKSQTTPKPSTGGKSWTSYVTMFTDDEEDTVTELATDEGKMEDILDEVETEDLLLNLCREYQLTKRQVEYILYINSGDVNDTLQWLRLSGECRGRLTWDIRDDEKLDGDLDPLFRKYGESVVQKRILFLDQL